MPTSVSSKELRNMQLSDLTREVSEKRVEVQKMRIGIDLNKEKDTAKYRHEKRVYARMMTILTEKQKEALQNKPASPTVTPPTKTRKTSSKKRS